jgi:hypothetical protein
MGLSPHLVVAPENKKPGAWRLRVVVVQVLLLLRALQPGHGPAEEIEKRVVRMHAETM